VIQFLLNGEWITESDLDPNLSILRYLRTKKGLSGTKEGCASGDCGACTVLLGEAGRGEDGKAGYTAVNSCITLLGAAHGKHIVTVDGLNTGETIHPVQQAMVENHASQCGFCTPGIVMSLVGLREGQSSCTREDTLSALSGNLCRCTGYRPIIDAAAASFKLPDNHNVINTTPDWQVPKQEGIAGLQHQHSRLFVPTTEAELQSLLQDYPQARFVAGATDLALEFTQQYKTIDCLISLSDVKELCECAETDNALHIGGAASYSRVMPWLNTWYPQVVELFERIGSRQIRNRGTIGGNIANASPIGDTPPVLLALDASVELASVGSTRVVALKEFFLDYKKTQLQAGEYIRRIMIPKPASNTQLKLYKVSKRFEDDISAIMAAFYFVMDGQQITEVRLAFGGMAAIPKFAEHAQAILQGSELNQASIEAAMTAMQKDFSPLTDVRASGAYRLKAAQNLLHKAYLEMSQIISGGVFDHA